jgi:hypothetical protein
VLLSRDFIDPAGKPLGADFINFYAASEFALQGRLAEAYDIGRMAEAQTAIVPAAAGQVVPWQYPPSFALLILPLALLPYSLACVLFMSATLLLYLWLVHAILPDRRALLVALAFTAVLVNALGGQNGFLSTALLGGGLIRLETRRILESDRRRGPDYSALRAPRVARLRHRELGGIPGSCGHRRRLSPLRRPALGQDGKRLRDGEATWRRRRARDRPPRRRGSRGGRDVRLGLVAWRQSRASSGARRDGNRARGAGDL